MQPNNPCFSLIDIDAEYMLPTNFKTYILDINESNKQKKPVWYFSNDFLQSYEAPDVSPNGLETVSQKILNNETFAIEFQWNKYKRGDKLTSCDLQCRTDLYCETVTVEEVQNAECKKDKINIKDSFMDIVMNIITDPWKIESN